jgi:CheY-like chemotaxis protein
MAQDTVLIIDDDPDLRELVALEVVGWGLRSIEAGSGPEALPLL